VPNGTSLWIATEMAIWAAGDVDAPAELEVVEEVGVTVGVGVDVGAVRVGVGVADVGVGDALCDGGGAIELGFDDGAELAVDGLGAGV